MARAILAPSVHNTQPWRFVISGRSVEIHADRGRRLRVLDPSGRQMLISCGCALFNARVALAASGYDVVVERFPEPGQRDLLARLTVGEPAGEWPVLAALDAVIELRQTNRRRFATDPVPPEVVDALVSAAAAEHAQLYEVTDSEQRYWVARLSQEADREQNADPAYRAELRAWTSDDPMRRDGVPSLAVPHVDAGAGDDVPIRDFDTRGVGWLPVATHSTVNQCLLLLGTLADRPEAWLRAGEALEHVLLEATRHGYVASPLTQVVEIAATRERLRTELGLQMHPHILMRVGRAPKTPASRRRRVEDVVVETDR
ncbi:MAG TPA: nitroreductase family protein [Jatrophihabitantaceae bacterium]